MGYPYPNFCLCAFLGPYHQDMSYLFYGASSFNQPLDTWNTPRVTDMSILARKFNYLEAVAASVSDVKGWLLRINQCDDKGLWAWS